MNVVRVVAGPSGPTPLDGGFVVAWNPHTRFGTCECSVTYDLARARRFADLEEIHAEWAAVSRVQPVRPDGRPNRPLSGLSIEILGG